MRAILLLALFGMFSQGQGHAAGQVVIVDQQATKYCQDCVNFFTDLQEMLSSANTTAQIEQLLDQMICSHFGALEPMCKDLVNQYVPQFLNYLASAEDPKQICGLLGMCTQEMMSLVKQKQPRGEECDLCKEAVNELKSLVRDQVTQGEIKDFIENQVCPLFGSLASECKQEVETYAALVFQVIVNELDPTVVCETLGLCTQAKTVSLTRVGLASLATQVKVITPQKVKVTTPHSKVKDTTDCVLCEFVMKEVDSLLANNRTQAAIEKALDEVCSVLPSTIEAECKNFVDQYGPMIINLLLQEITPKEVCQQLGLCQQSLRERADPACLLCEFVLSEIDDLIGNNKSQASVESALKKVCDLMPDTISAECRNFVDLYGPAVINLLIKELDPEAVCSTLRLCSNSKPVKVMKMLPRKKVSASPECLICEFVMKELDTMLMDNRTETAIRSALDKVCSVLPSTVRDTCVDFINTYSPAILELLVQELDPESICKTLGVCLNTGMKPKSVFVKPVGRSTEMCDLCVTVLNYVDELLKENGTVQDVEALLDKVCNFLPTQLQSQCLQFVTDYTALVLNLIGSDIDPRQICEDLKLCNASRKAFELKNNRLFFKPSNLIGTNKCTYGPSYWCVSKENAIECGSVEHCQKHVWN